MKIFFTQLFFVLFFIQIAKAQDPRSGGLPIIMTFKSFEVQKIDGLISFQLDISAGDTVDLNHEFDTDNTDF